MYGELFIKPWELHRMTFREVMLTIDGRNEKVELMDVMLYRTTSIIAASGMNAKAAISMLRKTWKLKSSEAAKQGLIERAREALEKSRRADDHKKVKEFIDGRFKDSSRG